MPRITTGSSLSRQRRVPSLFAFSVLCILLLPSWSPHAGNSCLLADDDDWDDASLWFILVCWLTQAIRIIRATNRPHVRVEETSHRVQAAWQTLRHDRLRNFPYFFTSQSQLLEAAHQINAEPIALRSSMPLWHTTCKYFPIRNPTEKKKPFRRGFPKAMTSNIIQERHDSRTRVNRNSSTGFGALLPFIEVSL